MKARGTAIGSEAYTAQRAAFFFASASFMGLDANEHRSGSSNEANGPQRK